MRSSIRNISGVSLANVGNGILGLIFVPVAVKRLGAVAYGEFAIYSILVSYVVLLELGLGKNLLRRLAGSVDEHYQLDQLRLAAGLYVTIAVLLLVTLPGIAYVVPRYLFPVSAELQGTVGRIAILAILDYVMGVPTSLMQTRCVASEQFGRYSRYAITSGAYRYGLGFLALLVTNRADVVVAFMVSRRIIDFWVARRIMGRLPTGAWRPRFNARAFGDLIRSSAALSIAQILQVTIVSIGAILVNRVFGMQSLGMYRAAFDVASKVWFLSNPAGLVLFPKFVRLLANRANMRMLTVLIPALLTLNCLLFSTIALIASGAAGPVFSRIGLGDQRYIQLFTLIVSAICLNGHANLAYEFTQAAGKFGNAVLFGVVSLGLLIGTFYVTVHLGPELSIGLAWLVSQIGYTFATDMSVHEILSPPWRSTLAAFAIRLAAIALMIAGALAVLDGRYGLYAASLIATSILSVVAVRMLYIVMGRPRSWSSAFTFPTAPSANT